MNDDFFHGIGWHFAAKVAFRWFVYWEYKLDYGLRIHELNPESRLHESDYTNPGIRIPNTRKNYQQNA